jgi:hypothetical protein
MSKHDEIVSKSADRFWPKVNGIDRQCVIERVVGKRYCLNRRMLRKGVPGHLLRSPRDEEEIATGP